MLIHIHVHIYRERGSEGEGEAGTSARALCGAAGVLTLIGEGVMWSPLNTWVWDLGFRV